MRLLLLLTFIAACSPPESACDLMAVSSVTVDLDAEDGGDLSGATVTYAVDGGDPVACDSFGSSDSFGASWSCGYEQAGVLTIRAEAGGYYAIERDVTVSEGECHVETEQVALTMEVESVDCTDSIFPSVLANVVGSTGEVLTGVAVTWALTSSEAAPQACTDYADDVWQCGEEVAGELEIYAIADGHVGQTQIVTVDADMCHVYTEDVRFELAWAPD